MFCFFANVYQGLKESCDLHMYKILHLYKLKYKTSMSLSYSGLSTGLVAGLARFLTNIQWIKNFIVSN